GPFVERLVEHERGQPMNETGLLRQLNKLGGQQPPLQRMVPSNQRFDADDEAGPQMQNRLILEKKFIMVDRRRELGGERHPAVRLAVAIGRIDGVSARV